MKKENKNTKNNFFESSWTWPHSKKKNTLRISPVYVLQPPIFVPVSVNQMNNNGNKRAPTTATQRLKQDYLRIKKDPVPYICAEPLPSNILEW